MRGSVPNLVSYCRQYETLCEILILIFVLFWLWAVGILFQPEQSNQAGLTPSREHLGFSHRVLGRDILGGGMNGTVDAESIAGGLVGLSLQDDKLGALEMRRNDVSDSVDSDCARTASTAAHERESEALAVGLADMAGEALR